MIGIANEEGIDLLLESNSLRKTYASDWLDPPYGNLLDSDNTITTASTIPHDGLEYGDSLQPHV